MGSSQSSSHSPSTASIGSSQSSSPSPPTASFEYDVFLSFRGEDTRKTFVDYLYSTLVERRIQTYKDDVTLSQGKSIVPSIKKAIKISQIAIIIFSENYANSSWCLDELAYIMKCREERELIVKPTFSGVEPSDVMKHLMRCREERNLIVLPVFYGVDPSDVREQKGDLGKVFAQQEIENINKAQLWRNALVDVCNIDGSELKRIVYGQEMEAIKEIVDIVVDRLYSFNLKVDKNLVGMRARLQDLQLRLDIESDGVRMVGIWGCGGSGKTTLATSVYIKISKHFEDHCIVVNVREKSKHGLKYLQENILSALLKEPVQLKSVMEGKHLIKSRLCHKKVLVLLDDVDNLDQLKALAGNHNWFGSGSRIIVTSRNMHLLRTTHEVDDVYPVRLLSHDEAIQLFNIHSHVEKHNIEYYETLSSIVVFYAAGNPLVVKGTCSLLYDQDKETRESFLKILIDIEDRTIMEILKISDDGLESYEKELFLDIACFWKGESIDKAMEVFKACGYHPEIGIRILIERGLIFIDVNGKFDMDDLFQQMGRYIVRGGHPINTEKHSRVWIKEEIRNMYFEDTPMENDKIEAISYSGYSYDHSSRFCNIVSNMKKLRWLKVNMEDDEENEKVEEHDGVPRFISNQLRYIDWEGYPASPLPDSLSKLVVLKLDRSKQKKIWKGYKHLPYMEVLELRHMNKLLITPSFDGLPHLQKLILYDCDELQEIHPSLGYHKSLEYIRISQCPNLVWFPQIFYMERLETLKIEGCGLRNGDVPSGISKLSNLQELDLSMNNFSRLDIHLFQLTRLKVLSLSWCNNLIELPEMPSSLSTLKADYCNSLTYVGGCFRNCRWLSQVSLMGGGVINDADILLQSMLKKEDCENRSMLLQLKGLAFPNRARPPLLKGSRCRLKVPKNWGNDFSGFLMCAIFVYDFCRSDSVRVSMKGMMSGMVMDSEDDVVWKESDSDKSTWVWYVPFASLRDSTWWDTTYKSVSFNIQDDNCSGFTAKLIRKRSRASQGLGYTPNFEIEQDSASELVLSLGLYYQ